MTDLFPSIVAAPGRRPSWSEAFRASFSEVAPIWWVLAAYALLAVVTSYYVGASFVRSVVSFLPFVLGLIDVSLVLGVVFLVSRIALIERSGNPVQRLRGEIGKYIQPTVASRAVLLIGAACALQVVYGFFKPLIPRFGPYRWDPFFAAADRVLFLGHHPWAVLWPLLGHPAVIYALNILYNFWFFWMLLVWVLVAFARRHRDANNQYFLAHVLVWSVGGTLMATVLAAAGPCYYGNFYTGPNPYRDLMAHLFAINDHVPVFSLAVQAMLWDGQMHPEVGKIAGISALPSLHITDAVLRTRIAFVHSRRLGFISAAATFAIFLASIVLGWHYAVDGVVGAAVALSAWWFAGKVMSWWRRRSPVAEPAVSLASY